MENVDTKKNTPPLGNVLLSPVAYGCPECGSKNYTEEGNNHHQASDEMEKMDYYKCQNCGHAFVF